MSKQKGRSRVAAWARARAATRNLPVPLEQDREGGLLPARTEALQKFAVRQVAVPCVRGCPAQVVQQHPEHCVCHDPYPSARGSTSIVRAGSASCELFCEQETSWRFFQKNSWTGKEVLRFVGHTGRIAAIALVSAGPVREGAKAPGCILASGATDNAIRLWDMATGKELRRWQARGQDGTRLCFSPDGKLLASTSVNEPGCEVYLWDVATGKEIRRLKGQKYMVLTLTFSPDGRVLASAGVADAIRFWDVATGKPLRAIPRTDSATEQTCMVQQIVFSPDGRTVASAEADGLVRLWEVATGELRRELKGHAVAVLTVAMSADGRRLASAGADTTALIWDLTGQRPKDLGAAWTQLVGKDAVAAYRAVLDLAAAGKPAVALIASYLKPVPAAEPGRIGRLVVDLNSPTFTTREKAQTNLETFADVPEPALRKALANNPSEELRRRIERLLARVATVQLHIGRALAVLERIGSLEARRLLTVLAGGAPEAWLTREARASLQRLPR
jgi:WD domain, G-beta repeat